MNAITFAISLILAAGLQSADSPNQSPPAQVGERQQLYQWFDSLGFDLKSGQFGEVKRWYDSNGKRNDLFSDFGFLRSQNGKTFSAMLLGLEVATFVDGKWAPHSYTNVEFEPRDLKAWLVEQRNQWDAAHSPTSQIYPYNPGYDPLTFTFVLSRLADLHGFRELSDSFYSKCSTSGVKEDLAQGLTRKARWSFDDPSLSRADLLGKMTFIVDHFPDSTYRREAESYAATLRPMVADDIVRKPLDDKALALLQAPDRAKELVWQLQDQNGHQYMHPGHTDIFMTNGGHTGKTAADKLVQLNLGAVPALIDALRDMRFTRTVQGGQHIVRPRVLRVRDAAVQILAKIANQQFSSDREGVHDDSDAEAEKIIANAGAWWKAVQTEGEEAVLVRGVAAGDASSPPQAWRLAEAYPASALEAIRKGVQNTKDEFNRFQLIDALTKVHSAEVKEFARKHMRSGKGLESRLSAAKVLNYYEPAEAVAAMAQEFRNLTGPHDWFFVEDDLEQFLADSCRVAAIRALASNLREVPVRRRLDVVLTFTGWAPPSASEMAKLKVTPKEVSSFSIAVEDLLAKELADREVRYGTSGSIGEMFSYDDPRLCDMAAFALSYNWPKKYRFQKSPSDSKRDEQCLGSLNIWRKSRGLGPIAAKAKSKVRETSYLDLLPLIVRFEHGNYSSSEILSKGRGALPALLRYEKTLPTPSSKLEELACKVSNIVSTVELVRFPDTARSFGKQLQALKGKPLDSNTVLRLVDQLLKTWPGNSVGARLLATKDEDGSGIHLTVDLGLPKNDYPNQVDFAMKVMSAGVDVFNISGAGDASYVMEPGFKAALRKALSANPLASVTIMFSAQRTRK